MAVSSVFCSTFFFFNDTAPPEIYTLSLHDALPISPVSGSPRGRAPRPCRTPTGRGPPATRSEEHTSELQSLAYLVCRLLLEKKKRPALGLLQPIVEAADEGRTARVAEVLVGHFFLLNRRPPRSTLFPYPPPFRSLHAPHTREARTLLVDGPVEPRQARLDG